MSRSFASDQVWKPAGRGFSMGIIEPDGVTVHLTGQVAWTADGELVGAGDVRAQTRACFENIERLLAVVGGRLSDIVSVTTWFVRDGDLADIQVVRAELLGHDDAPVSTSVRVAALGDPGFLVELTPVAVIPRERFRPPV